MKTVYGLALALHMYFVLCPFCSAQEIMPPSLDAKNDSLAIIKSTTYSGKFRIDSISTVDEFTLYYVTCVDTIDLKWGGVFWITTNYYGIGLTIVTSDDSIITGNLIKTGDIFELDLVPYYGAWRIREHYDNRIQYDTLYKKDGSHILIPRNNIWSQLMVSSKIRGKYYYSNGGID